MPKVSVMREDPGMQPRETVSTGFRIRLQVAVGVGAVLVASMVASPFAAAAVSHGASAASHSARVGSSRTVLVPLAASNSRQGTWALVAPRKGPVPTVPHWGVPLMSSAARKGPVPTVPHWGVPLMSSAARKGPVPTVPHWGVPLMSSATRKGPVPTVPHWGVPLMSLAARKGPVPTVPHWGAPLESLVTV